MRSNVIHNSKLSRDARLLYALLDDYAGQKGEAWPSMKTLMADLDASERAVQKWLKELRDASLYQPLEEPGRRLVRRLDWATPAQPCADPRTSVHPPPHVGAPTPAPACAFDQPYLFKEPRKEPRKEQTEARGIVSRSFPQFWERWAALTGRLQKQSAAAGAWVSVVTVQTEGLAMECLERYGASDEVGRGVVCNPDRWIYDQARDGFKGEWPGRLSLVDRRSRDLARAIGDD